MATLAATPTITPMGIPTTIRGGIRTIIRAATPMPARSLFAPTATTPTIPTPARLMGITRPAILLTAFLLGQVPGITATTAAGITVVADTATAQDTAGIIAAGMTIAMETEATEVDTVGAAIAMDIGVAIVDIGAAT